MSHCACEFDDPDAEPVKWCLIHAAMRDENARLKQWVNDLQSGMFINCVYCGHQYGPDPGTPVAMADVLKAHIEKCPKHPLSRALAENARLLAALKKYGAHRECDAVYRNGWVNPSCTCGLDAFLAELPNG